MTITKKGFTLVELLVVIAIIGVLAAVVVLVINPIELTKRSRDAARLTDLANLQQAINVAAQEATGSSAAILCSPDGLTLPCTGQSNVGGQAARAADGTGWVKVDLSSQNSVSVPTLPVDPTNSVANHYTYCSDGNAWEIATALESVQQGGKMGSDGGSDPVLYEVGSDLTLIQPSGGDCVY